MELAEVPFNDIISPAGTQFVIPIWQRLYSWGTKEWNDLWEDLMNLYERMYKGESVEHFMGSIVVKTVEEKVGEMTKRTLIDGQQRLTTLLLICAILRNMAREEGNTILAEKIEDLILFNRYAKKAEEKPKLRPTEADLKLFNQIVNGESVVELDYGSQLYFAYGFFEAKLRDNKDKYDIEGLLNAIRALRIVTIRLDPKDNPNRIFETLNFRGRKLAQSDLIRNYFMMAIKDPIHANQVYQNIWYPMQQSLGSQTWERIENLESFLRHFIVMNLCEFVREDHIYSGMREQLKQAMEDQVISELETIGKYSRYYCRLLFPEREENAEISEGLRRLNRLNVRVHYPFLLKLYHAFHSEPSTITKDDFCETLKTIESYIVRRFFQGLPTHSLNRLFASLCGLPEDKLVDSLKTELSTKESWRAQYWPTDDDFREKFRTIPLYKVSSERCRFVLETLEANLGHPEEVKLENLTIEHVMPETLTAEWISHLGENWQSAYDKYVHTIGNLTLIAGAPNATIQNKLFPEKKKEWYTSSHVELTKEIAQKWNEWTAFDIQERANLLAERAIKIWPRPM